ncbi:MAG: hypothetical protein J07HQX50_01194 [Haloquadratum sp. J07HQX50]|nr:MAG: hypothetical protein J07HQX50_01194 [Haloquadratum sp. J07HQX50]
MRRLQMYFKSERNCKYENERYDIVGFIWLDMVSLLHTGIEHPKLLWVIITGMVMFIAGLLVNLYRTRDMENSNLSSGDNTEV